LAKETIERAGLIEDGQVLIAIFRSIPIGEIGVTDPSPAGADPIGDAVGGQWVVIPANITFSSIGPDKPAIAILAQATVAFLARANEAQIYTEIALLTLFILGRLCRQMEGLPRLPVRPFN